MHAWLWYFSHGSGSYVLQIRIKTNKIKFQWTVHIIFRLLEYEMKDVCSVFMLFKQRLSSSRHR